MGLVARASHGWRLFVRFASGEFLLRGRHHRANGGAVILARALLVTALTYFPAIGLYDYLAPGAKLAFSAVALASVIRATFPWIGAIFGGVYAVLYSKFGSQWTYLAGLYNQIKASEAQIAIAGSPASAMEVLVSTKAGFIEDADELHLAAKPMYAAIIRSWAGDAAVKAEFEQFAPGGAQRFAEIVELVEFVHASEETRYWRRGAMPKSIPPKT